MTEILLVIAVVVVLAIAFIVLSRRSGGSALKDFEREGEMEDGVVGDPVPISSTESARALNGNLVDDTPTVDRDPIKGPGAHDSGIRWATQFEPRSGKLSDAARLRLINDLGMLGAPWCIPLLTKACEQETDAAYLVAARVSLARCREGEAVS